MPFNLKYIVALAGVVACGPSPDEQRASFSPEAVSSEQDFSGPTPGGIAPASRAAAGGSSSGASAPMVQSAASTDTGTTGAPVMIIRTGHASVEVRNVDEAAAKVRALAASLGGYVANSSFQGGEHTVRSATLELKVPAVRYDDAVARLASIGEVESVNSSSEDVGEEYVDLTARAANARRLEQRLIQLLATRTGRLEDVLAVERELARVREQIERMEGRLRYLRTRATLSTLTVVVHEAEPILGKAGDNPIVAAFKAAWRNFVRFVAGLIAAMGVIIPIAAIGAGGFLLYRRFWRKLRP